MAVQRMKQINWDNQTTKMFSFAALDVVKDKHPELFRTILATWWSGESTAWHRCRSDTPQN